MRADKKFWIPFAGVLELTMALGFAVHGAILFGDHGARTSALALRIPTGSGPCGH